jgi:hypothetical protein
VQKNDPRTSLGLSADIERVPADMGCGPSLQATMSAAARMPASVPASVPARTTVRLRRVGCICEFGGALTDMLVVLQGREKRAATSTGRPRNRPEIHGAGMNACRIAIKIRPGMWRQKPV